MKSKLKFSSLLIALTLSAGIVQAQQTPAPQLKSERSLRFVVGIGLTGGGDKLASVNFVGGSSESITAGGLLHMYLGGEYRFSKKASAQLNVGYQVHDTSSASNGSLKFKRVPIELLGHYAVTDQVRLGAGLRLAQDAALRGSGVLSGSASFESDPAFVVEGEYMFSPAAGMKLRYVNEKYKLKGSNLSVDGSHAGLMFSYYF